MKTVIIAIGLCIISALLLKVDDGIAQVSVGEKAPNFVNQSLDGDRYELAELKGKVVYIFFFGANCPHCISNGPATEKAIYQNFKSDTNFVALGLDTWNYSASAVESFKKTTGITYPLLLNAEQTLVNYYGNSYSYDRSVVIDSEGIVAYKGNDFVDTDTADVKQTIGELLEGIMTNVEDEEVDQPVSTTLYQNYPNPFNPATTIRFDLSRSSQVSLSVYNEIGQEVANLVNRQMNAGSHSLTFKASGLPSGVYIYQLNTGNYAETRKMLLLK